MITVKTPVFKLLKDLSNLTGDEKSKAKIYNGDILNQSIEGVLTKNYINDAKTYFSIDDLIAAIDEGGEVYGFWPYVKILTEDINNSTPVGLVKSIREPVYSIPEVEGEEIVELEPARQKTWSEWANLDGNYTSTTIDDYTYFGAHYCAVDGGRALHGTELIVIHNTPGVELVTSMPEPKEQI